MSIEKTALLKKLVNIKQNGPKHPSYGICFNSYVDECTGDMCHYRAMEWMASTWPNRSGSNVYPIAYTGGPLWDNPDRWELLDHCIDFLTKNLADKR